MGADSGFICDRCQRSLPTWMETENGLCRGCADNKEDVVWSTDDSEGELTTSFTSQSSDIATADAPDENTGAPEDPDSASDGSSADADSIPDDNSADDTSAAGSTPHAIDSFWSETIDTSHLDDAADDARSQATQDTSESSDPLDRKIDSWKEQLLDLTRRSNLVDFSVTKTKSLPFHRADPLAVGARLVEQDPLYMRKSASDDDGGTPADVEALAGDEVASIRSLEDTANSLNRLQLKQKRFQRERGVDALFLALGTLRWYDVDHSDTEHRTPLFLVQVALSDEPNRDAEKHDYEITTTDADLRFNPALRKMLLAERGLVLPPDEALALDDLEAAFAFVDNVISGFDRWRIVPEVILGIFDFSKFGLYADLEENREAIKKNGFVRAINGDPSALPAPPDTPTASELDDSVSPVDTYQVLDADSSQQEAIEAAKRGMSFVLQGPPGTGKSQTIANIIAEKIAAGETVLFVSEKQAALNVVKSRLDDVGLGRFCLEAHGEKATKAAVLEDLERELNSPPLESPSDRSKVVDDLEQVRNRLNAYQDLLFYSPPGQDITPYEAFGIVSKHDDHPRLDVDFGDPTNRTQDQINEARANLESLTAYGSQLNRDGTHPWQSTTLDGWRVSTRSTVETGVESALSALADIQDQATRIRDHLGVSIESFVDFEAAASVLEHLARRPDVPVVPEHFHEQFYARDDRLEAMADLHQTRAEKRQTLSERYDQSYFAEDGAALHAEASSYGILRFLKPSFWKFRRRLLDQTTPDYDPGFQSLTDDTQRLKRVEAIDEELDATAYNKLAARLGPLYR